MMPFFCLRRSPDQGTLDVVLVVVVVVVVGVAAAAVVVGTTFTFNFFEICRKTL